MSRFFSLLFQSAGGDGKYNGDQTIWLRYAEFEMRSKFPNHARNVWDRAVALLPRVDQFWYKYSYMEVRKANERATYYCCTRC